MSNVVAVIKTACQNLGYDVRSYSGRGMYGRRCIGIDIDRSTSTPVVAFRLATELISMDETEVLEQLSEVDWCTDSMGRDAIMYAPDLRWNEGEHDDV